LTPKAHHAIKLVMTVCAPLLVPLPLLLLLLLLAFLARLLLPLPLLVLLLTLLVLLPKVLLRRMCSCPAGEPASQPAQHVRAERCVQLDEELRPTEAL
jgi:hypothetical protein